MLITKLPRTLAFKPSAFTLVRLHVYRKNTSKDPICVVSLDGGSCQVNFANDHEEVPKELKEGRYP